MDFNSAQPVVLMPAKARVIGDDDTATAAGVDTIGWSKLWVFLNNGTTEDNVGKFFIEFSADNSTWSRPHPTAGLLSYSVTADTVQSAYFDLAPEMRYVRVLYEFPTGSGTDAAVHPTAVMGLLMDPSTTDLVTHTPSFIAAAHNRA